MENQSKYADMNVGKGTGVTGHYTGKTHVMMDNCYNNNRKYVLKCQDNAKVFSEKYFHLAHIKWLH